MDSTCNQELTGLEIFNNYWWKRCIFCQSVILFLLHLLLYMFSQQEMRNYAINTTWKTYFFE